MQHCIKTLQGICLAQGVKLASKGVHDQDPATKKWDSGATTQFQKHIDKYFVAFCEEAIRCFYVCGFVPWHVRRLASTGDLVPEVLPLGTFTWCAPPAVPFMLFTFLIFYHTTGTSNSEPKRKSATGWRRRSGASVRLRERHTSTRWWTPPAASRGEGDRGASRGTIHHHLHRHAMMQVSLLQPLLPLQRLPTATAKLQPTLPTTPSATAQWGGGKGSKTKESVGTQRGARGSGKTARQSTFSTGLASQTGGCWRRKSTSTTTFLQSEISGMCVCLCVY